MIYKQRGREPKVLHGLIFGLASLFVPQADLPNPATLKIEMTRFADTYQVDMSKVAIKHAKWKNPSPLLASASRRGCTIYINQYDKAHDVWSYLLSDSSIDRELYEAYSLGHELGHCLIGRDGVRAEWRKAMETRLGHTFQTNAHFEEALCDLIGLAYVSKLFPERAEAMLSRVRDIREEFSGRDASHDSRHALTMDSIHWAEQLLQIKSAPLRSAARGEGRSEPPSPT